MSNQEAWFCLIRRVLEAAVEEHLHLSQLRVVAVAVQLRLLKTLLWRMDGGGGAVGTRQPDRIKATIRILTLLTSCKITLEVCSKPEI